jgi:ADP-heptose:LPS heptosyltransferase
VTPVLFARAGALGDFVLTLPVLRALTTRGPVHVVTDARYAPLLPPGAVRVDAPWLFAGRPAPVGYAFGVAFSPTMAGCMRASGLPAVHDVAPRPPPGVHATAHYASVLAGVLGPFDLVPHVAIAPDPTITDAPVVIAPGSGGAEKRWPMARWRAVAAALADLPVRWVRGPVEADEAWPVDAIAPDLPTLAALAAAAGVWLGPDAGPSHLAAAVGAPVGVVFGVTDPACWAPPGARVWAWDVAADVIAEWTRGERVSPPRTRRGG